MKPGFTREPVVKFHVRGSPEQVTAILSFHTDNWQYCMGGGSGPIRDQPGMSASHCDVSVEFADRYEAKLVELGLRKLKRHR
jgi:hypothetical protein